MKLICIGSGSSGNGYLLTNGKETLILELGMPFKEVKKALNFDLSSIVGGIVSHFHGDHYKYHAEYENAGIPIYKPFMTEDKVVTFGGFWIQSFDVPHSVPNYGFVILHKELGGGLIFATDFEYIGYRFEKLKPSHMVIEANYCKSLVDEEAENRNHVLFGHAEIDTTVEFIKSNKTDNMRNVILCHLSSRNADEDMFLEKVRAVVDCPVYVATKGMEVEL